MSHVGFNPKPRSKILKTITLTAAITFFATTAGQYLFGKVADGLLHSAGSPLGVQIRFLEPTQPFHVVIPQSLEQVKEPRLPNDGSAVLDWAESLGGGAADSSRMEVTVWGTRDYPVQLEDVTVEIDKCTSTPAWTYIRLDGGGSLPNRLIVFNLLSPYGTTMPNEDGEEWSFPLYVSKSEPERFSVEVTASGGDCYYFVVIHYTANNKEDEERLRNNGDPFRLISSSRAAIEKYWLVEGDEVTIRK